MFSSIILFYFFLLNPILQNTFCEISFSSNIYADIFFICGFSKQSSLMLLRITVSEYPFPRISSTRYTLMAASSSSNSNFTVPKNSLLKLSYSIERYEGELTIKTVPSSMSFPLLFFIIRIVFFHIIQMDIPVNIRYILVHHFSQYYLNQ